MLSNRAAVRSASLKASVFPQTGEKPWRLPLLAADPIAANVLAVKPRVAGRALSKIRPHGAGEAEEAQETLNWVAQMTCRVVGTRLANLHETTTHEEQPV
jgi:hypothetical protein